MVQNRVYIYFRRNLWLHIPFIFDKKQMNRAELSKEKCKEVHKYIVDFDRARFKIKYMKPNGTSRL